MSYKSQGRYLIPYSATNLLWPASTEVVRELLGIPGKLPPNAMPTKIIQGYDRKTAGTVDLPVWVTPFQPKSRKSSTHRIMTRCPSCNAVISVGRLHQHSTIHL